MMLEQTPSPTCSLLCGEALATLRDLPTASVHAVVTDPPYELGFMNRAWDQTGIAFSTDLWREVLRVCKPGAHLLAFSGTRTSHRMVCAIEDAGWEIRDSIHWLYATGWPKGSGLLKPAHEPIVLARKQFRGSIAANGLGALQTDACRIGFRDVRIARLGALSGHGIGYGSGSGPQVAIDGGQGRWPANVVLSCACPTEDHSASCPVVVLDTQSGVSSSHATQSWEGRRANRTGFTGPMPANATIAKHDDVGGASRFFFVAKPSRAERDAGMVAGGNTHISVKPLELLHYLCRLVTPPGGTVLDPFMGSGTTGMAALAEGFGFLGIDQDPTYVEIARQRLGLLAHLGGAV